MPKSHKEESTVTDTNTADSAVLRAAGAQTAAVLPPISPQSAHRIAELPREPINQYVSAQRRRAPKDGAA
jgi:hypothetical protein